MADVHVTIALKTEEKEGAVRFKLDSSWTKIMVGLRCADETEGKFCNSNEYM